MVGVFAYCLSALAGAIAFVAMMVITQLVSGEQLPGDFMSLQLPGILLAMAGFIISLGAVPFIALRVVLHLFKAKRTWAFALAGALMPAAIINMITLLNNPGDLLDGRITMMAVLMPAGAVAGAVYHLIEKRWSVADRHG
jgi:hypothetical protein